MPERWRPLQKTRLFHHVSIISIHFQELWRLGDGPRPMVLRLALAALAEAYELAELSQLGLHFGTLPFRPSSDGICYLYGIIARASTA